MSAPVSSLSPWVDRRRGRCQMGISAELSVGNVVVQLRHKEFFVRRCFHVPFMLGELAANSGVTYLLLLVNSLWGVASRHIHIAVMTFRHGKAWLRPQYLKRYTRNLASIAVSTLSLHPPSQSNHQAQAAQRRLNRHLSRARLLPKRTDLL